MPGRFRSALLSLYRHYRNASRFARRRLRPLLASTAAAVGAAAGSTFVASASGNARRTLRWLYREACRLALRRPRLTLGVTAAAIAAVAGVASGTSSGQAPHGNTAQPHAQARAAAAQPRPQQAGTQRQATRHARATSNAAPAAPARPYQFYDAVTPSAIPAHQRIATYATGRYAVPASHLAGRGHVMWIDVFGKDPAASALDVEPGNATPSVAANWASHRLHAYPGSIAHIYTMRSEWPAVRGAVAKLPASDQSRVRWWIADPTGAPHIVPGSSATQWYWGPSYDITTANPDFG